MEGFICCENLLCRGCPVTLLCLKTLVWEGTTLSLVGDATVYCARSRFIEVVAETRMFICSVHVVSRRVAVKYVG